MKEKGKAVKLTYKVFATQDNTPVRGNAMVSGDAAADREAENEILERLYCGDIWAWASVAVTCSIDGFDYTGIDHLGCCCYRNESEFREDAYFADMCAQAKENLISELRSSVEKGKEALALLQALEA